MDRQAVVIFVCCIYFVGVISAGLVVMARNRKASDFLLAGRKLNLLFIVATLTEVQIGAGIILDVSWAGVSLGI